MGPYVKTRIQKAAPRFSLVSWDTGPGPLGIQEVALGFLMIRGTLVLEGQVQTIHIQFIHQLVVQKYIFQNCLPFHVNIGIDITHYNSCIQFQTLIVHKNQFHESQIGNSGIINIIHIALR